MFKQRKMRFLFTSFFFIFSLHLFLFSNPTEAGTIYWTEDGSGKVKSSNLDGSNVQELVTGLTDPYGIDLDLTNNKMYWGDVTAGALQRADLDGANVETIISQSTVDVALDVSGGKVYYGNTNINRADLDGSNSELLVGTPINGLTLDLTADKIYWTEPDRIRKSNLDGSNVETVFNEAFLDPHGIQLDLDAGKMYLASENGEIVRYNLDGTNKETLVSIGGTSFFDLALDLEAGHIYWTNFSQNKIQRSNLDGSNVTDIIASGLSAPTGITLQGSSAVPEPSTLLLLLSALLGGIPFRKKSE